MINIADIAKQRYTCKAYDPTRTIPKETIEQLYSVLRDAPSSVNSQPWHYVVVESSEAKKKILPAIAEFNHPRITDASHVVIFCAKNEMDEAHIEAVLAHEERDERFPDEEIKAANDKGRRHFININNESETDLHAWEGKQLYLALGNLLLAATALGVDSTAIEGFDPTKLDSILELDKKGYHSVVIASLGYRSKEDFNAELKKSRFPLDDILTII